MNTQLKKSFPILSRKIHGKPLVYLDNASTTQKPKAVLEALMRYYATSNANIHRGIHTLSEESTELFEATRKSIAQFIHAKSDEIIFTKSGTEAINCIAATWGRAHIKKDDVILLSIMEHHSNLVPWQELARAVGARIRFIPLTKDYLLDEEAYRALLTPRVKLVCLTAASNVLGTVTPIKKCVQLAHAIGARVLVDGAQSIGHLSTDVYSLDCDFFTFSAHKMYGPTGVGVLFVKKDILATLPPYQFGGDMVLSVNVEGAIFREGLARFEAGTPNIADVVAFRAAIELLTRIGLDEVRHHDRLLLSETRECLGSFSSVQIYAPSDPNRGIGVISFTIDGIHPHDIATVFDSEGVAIRSGLHCAEPLVRSLGVSATARISFGVYTTGRDIAAVKKALKKTMTIFRKRNT